MRAVRQGGDWERKDVLVSRRARAVLEKTCLQAVPPFGLPRQAQRGPERVLWRVSKIRASLAQLEEEKRRRLHLRRVLQARQTGKDEQRPLSRVRPLQFDHLRRSRVEKDRRQVHVSHVFEKEARGGEKSEKDVKKESRVTPDAERIVSFVAVANNNNQ